MRDRYTMYEGRVDVMQKSGKEISIRTTVSGIHFNPDDFFSVVRERVDDVCVSADFIVGRLNTLGYEPKKTNTLVSIAGGALLIECIVSHSEPDNRYGRITMDRRIIRIIDEFNKEYNSSN